MGPQVAEKLKARLEDIRAAANVTELSVGSPRAVGVGAGQRMVVNLEDGYRIEFSANHTSNPVTPSGTIDWEKVRRVKIQTIERS